MRRRLLIITLAVAGLGVAGQAASSAGNPVPGAVPPVCVNQNFPAGLHLQVGYCP
jgi:hypothetical protein